MRNIILLKEQCQLVNNLCVKTYMEVLGYYGVTISGKALAIFPSPFDEVGRLYVDKHINRFRLSHGKLTGGYAGFGLRVVQRDPKPYREEYRPLPHRSALDQVRFPVRRHLVIGTVPCDQGEGMLRADPARSQWAFGKISQNSEKMKTALHFATLV